MRENDAAIDLVNEFVIASGRKLGRSIFAAPKDRKFCEEVLGQSLEEIDL